MSAVTVRLTPEDQECLTFLRGETAIETPTQLVRFAIRRSARQLGWRPASRVRAAGADGASYDAADAEVELEDKTGTDG